MRARGFHQLQEFLFTGAIETFAGLKTGGSLKFSQGCIITPQVHQASGKIVVIIGCRLKAQGLAKFGFGTFKILAAE